MDRDQIYMITRRGGVCVCVLWGGLSRGGGCRWVIMTHFYSAPGVSWSCSACVGGRWMGREVSKRSQLREINLHSVCGVKAGTLSTNVLLFVGWPKRVDFCLRQRHNFLI